MKRIDGGVCSERGVDTGGNADGIKKRSHFRVGCRTIASGRGQCPRKGSRVTAGEKPVPGILTPRVFGVEVFESGLRIEDTISVAQDAGRSTMCDAQKGKHEND
jgi:hypothetical protein